MEIQDYPNYLIYPDGKIFNKKRKIFMKSNPDSTGYVRIGLSNSEGLKPFLIHRLIAIHYIPNPENKPAVDHIDRNKQNNDLSNLRWATNSENQQNVGIRKDNTTGFKNISYTKRGYWLVQYRKYKISKCFKSKMDALCYKYINELKIKAGLLI